MTITEKISTAVIPATAVSRINRKGKMMEEQGNNLVNNVERTLEHVSSNSYERKSKRRRFVEIHRKLKESTTYEN